MVPHLLSVPDFVPRPGTLPFFYTSCCSSARRLTFCLYLFCSSPWYLSISCTLVFPLSWFLTVCLDRVCFHKHLFLNCVCALFVSSSWCLALSLLLLVLVPHLSSVPSCCSCPGTSSFCVPYLCSSPWFLRGTGTQTSRQTFAHTCGLAADGPAQTQAPPGNGMYRGELRTDGHDGLSISRSVRRAVGGRSGRSTSRSAGRSVGRSVGWQVGR